MNGFVYTPKTAEFYGGEQSRRPPAPVTLTQWKSGKATDAKSVKKSSRRYQFRPEKNPNDLFLRLQAETSTPPISIWRSLARITPFRFTASLNYQGEKWNGTIEPSA